MSTELLSALGIVDCLVLRQLDNTEFVKEFGCGTWITKVFISDQGKPINISGASSYLDNFLIDALEFWQQSSETELESGIWSEEFDGVLYHLRANAKKIDEQCYLVISNVEKVHHEKQQTLQIAREVLVANERVSEQHDYMQARMRKILVEESTHSHAYLSDAIKFADIGVMVTDENSALIEVNPAALEIFETDTPATVHSLTTNLISEQFPSSARLPLSTNTWHGELYWYLPPQSHKWLQVNITPVIGTDRKGTISHYIYTLSDITRLKFLLHTNQELRLKDVLTNLPNRQALWQQLQQLTSTDAAFYLAYIDIENFKQVNEMFGHIEGDQLLINVKDRLLAQLSNKENLFRIGANEFALIYQQENSDISGKPFFDNSFQLSQNLVEAIKVPFVLPSQKVCELNINVGLAQYPKDAQDSEELMSSADLAINSAKQNNNDYVVYYSNALKAASKRRIIFAQELSKAIENNQLELLLQPITNIETGITIKAEALLRWNISETEVVMPDDFIPLAEENGLIVNIGRWVIDKVCEILAQLATQDHQIPISLNLSPRQLSDTGLISYIKACLSQYKLAPNRLELEVTEGVFVNKQVRARELLESLRALGISVSIDDFGTGYSSLSYLKHLPVDNLKVDRSFVMDLDSNKDDQAIVLAIIAMAQRLGIGIIAEGVENKYQQHFLIEAGCKVAQGFLFSAPMSVDKFISEHTKIK